jgi:Flp pilus assembly protein TadD
MCKRLFLLVALFLPVLAPARDKRENWLEVRSPHFSVVSNSNEKQARRVADQFERMRSVFHTLLPKLNVDAGSPIIVLAIEDDKDFRALEPAAYLAKGQLRLAGLFLRGMDKNYVLLRLDAEGEHPYAAVYHEYTHLLFSKADGMPLWLDEGLAEFYQNTDIHEKYVSLGQPSRENLALLQQNRLLPLPTLFAVDHSSPYYHEENKGSIFYAESWALTHYLEYKDVHDQAHRVHDYLQLMAQGIDTMTAATRAFGDLKQLQSALEEYVRQGSFQYLRIPDATDVDDAVFQTRVLSAPQADAVRADFLAYNARTADARTLLDRILQEDPNNVLAHETMGFLEFQERHLDQARNWYAQAVKLDSQSYLAHYYFAAISMNSAMDPAEETQVESSLRASIKLNPNFAPSYDRLAAFLAMRHRNLDEARLLAVNAVQLEPGNLSYRMNTATILLRMQRGEDAVAVIRAAMHLASSPQETAMAENLLQHAEQYVQDQEEGLIEQMEPGTTALETTSHVVEPHVLANPPAHEEALVSTPHHFVVGVLRNVHCNTPAMDLNVVSSGKTLGLHTDNYYKVEYSMLNVTLKGDLKPCADLEGRSVKVEYADSASNGVAMLVAIEIHK